MSLRTFFLRSEYNLWRGRIRIAWQNIKFSYAVRPLKYRFLEFAQKYLFLGISARWRREKQAVANAARFQAQISERQRLCPHLKGMRFLNMTGARRPSVLEDYNVSFHRFINNRGRVICNYCKRVWWEGDPDWKDALNMVAKSNNKPSSSEIPAAVLRGEFPWKSSAASSTKSSFFSRVLRTLKNSLTSLRKIAGM